MDAVGWAARQLSSSAAVERVEHPKSPDQAPSPFLCSPSHGRVLVIHDHDIGRRRGEGSQAHELAEPPGSPVTKGYQDKGGDVGPHDMHLGHFSPLCKETDLCAYMNPLKQMGF